MTTQITWTANTAAEAIGLLRAAIARIGSSLDAAHPGDSLAAHDASKTIPLDLRIAFDLTAVEQHTALQQNSTKVQAPPADKPISRVRFSGRDNS